MEKRYLFSQLKNDALKDHKIAIISGPRQVGKTTLAKEYLTSSKNYFTWDDDNFRKAWMRSALTSIEHRGAGPIVLDEVHKDKKRWKQKLKGIYDQIGSELEIIVTGSARQDIYRKGSDSMMGRYIPYRLYPFTVAESSNPIAPHELFHSECKSNKEEPSPHLIHFSKLLGTKYNYQLVTKSGFHRNYPHWKIEVMHYEKFLSGLL